MLSSIYYLLVYLPLIYILSIISGLLLLLVLLLMMATVFIGIEFTGVIVANASIGLTIANAFLIIFTSICTGII